MVGSELSDESEDTKVEQWEGMCEPPMDFNGTLRFVG